MDMDSVPFPGSPSRIVVKRTFIEEVNSPRGADLMRARASSDSALYEMGEEEERRQRAREMEAKMADEVEFVMDGLSDAETTSEHKDTSGDEKALPCYSHLPEATAPTLPVMSAKTPHHDQLVDATPEHRLDSGYAPCFAAVLADASPQDFYPGRADPEAEGSTSSDSDLHMGESAFSRMTSTAASSQLPQPNADLERLLRENQRLAMENQMLREYGYVQVAEGFSAHEGGAATAMPVTPTMPWVFQMGPMGMVAVPMAAQTSEAQPKAASRRQRGANKAAAKVAVATKGAVRGGVQSDASGSSEVTTVPEQLRTTVMLRNLPNNYSRAMLLDLLDQEGFAGMYNFLYLPIDFKSRACLGYAFINLINPGVVAPFWRKFDGFSSWILPSKKVCHVSWSGPHQGLSDHVERYRNSPIMHPSVVDEYKPLIFQDGVRVPFPEPTKSTRAPRIRNKTSAAASSSEAFRG